MKRLKVFLSVLVLTCIMSSCAGSRKSKCDCPKFSDEPTQQEQRVDDNYDA